MNLHLLQLGDSALPIGGYSHSWGLEAAIEQGVVRDPAALEGWVRDWLSYAVAPLEGVVVARSYQAALESNWDEVKRANELLAASLVPPTIRQASRDMGEQFLSLAEPWLWSAGTASALRSAEAAADFSGWHHAVVFGAFGAATGSSAMECLLTYLHQAALGSIGAGVRGIPIGHTAGQQILARVHPVLPMLAAETQDKTLDAAGSSCPAYEVFCHAQSQLYTRIFRS